MYHLLRAARGGVAAALHTLAEMHGPAGAGGDSEFDEGLPPLATPEARALLPTDNDLKHLALDPSQPHKAAHLQRTDVRVLLYAAAARQGSAEAALQTGLHLASEGLDWAGALAALQQAVDLVQAPKKDGVAAQPRVTAGGRLVEREACTSPNGALSLPVHTIEMKMADLFATGGPGLERDVDEARERYVAAGTAAMRAKDMAAGNTAFRLAEALPAAAEE
jgi:hypothetical protein